MFAFGSPRERAQLLLLALGLALTVAVLPLAAGLLGALVLFVGLAPVHRRLAARIPRRGAAVLVVVAAALLIVLPLAWLFTVTINRVPEAFGSLVTSPSLARLAAVRIGDVDLGSRIVAASGDLGSWLSGQALRALGGAVRATVNAVVALFGLYFLLLATPRAWAEVASFLPFSRAGADALAERFRHVTEATLLGTALTAVLQGTAVALGFALTGLGEAWFWGVVTAIVSILPVFGSALVWFPGAVALAIQGRYGAAVSLAALGAIVVSNIDNVMRPLVNRRVSNLHPMITLVGAFAGVGVLGLPGILLGPLAISYFFELLRLYRLEYGPAEPQPIAAPPDGFTLASRMQPSPGD